MTAARRGRYRAGILAEWLAAAYLAGKGYRIERWRCKTPLGEIDLIARKGDMIVFVEVKGRRAERDALEAVGARTQYRIARAAAYLLPRRPDWRDKILRFDVIAISWPFFIRHIDNAWRPQA